MTNGWTGGQWSLFRVLFGAYLFVHLAELVPWGAEIFSSAGVLPDGRLSPLLHLFPNVLAAFDSPAFVTALLVAGAVLAIPFALGCHDRAAAVALWYLLACLHGRNPLIANPSLPYVGWALLAHACLPTAPYGSLAARGRIDPDGGWRMTPSIFAAAWILLALGYTYGGITKLTSPSWIDGSALGRVIDNPLARPTLLRELLVAIPAPLLMAGTWAALAIETLFAPLALVRPLRPLLWGAMVAMHSSLIVLIDFADLSIAMLLFHLFTFDPAWLPPRRRGPERLFFDGGCGLCHRAVRFLLAEDRTETIRFAPLESEAFAALASKQSASALPDSIVLETEDGRLLVRARAVLHLLDRLGGLWRVIGWTLCPLPIGALDALYDLIARNRKRFFAKPAEACPILPPALRRRFDEA